MSGQHSNPTIAFRPTQWEWAMIEEWVKASGLYKKDFIARSCIYSNIVVVGTKQRVQYLVEELRETQIVMKYAHFVTAGLPKDVWLLRHKYSDPME